MNKSSYGHESANLPPTHFVTKQELQDIAAEAGVSPTVGSRIFRSMPTYARKRKESGALQDIEPIIRFKGSEPAINIEVIGHALATGEYVERLGKASRMVMGLAYEQFHEQDT